MRLQWSTPEITPRTYLLTRSDGTPQSLTPQNCALALPEQIAAGNVGMTMLSDGLALIHSEMNFRESLTIHEQHERRRIFQLCFCLEGDWQWDFGSSSLSTQPMRCSLQQGFFDRCTSFFAAGARCRTLSLSLEPARYPDLADTLAAAHLLVGDCPVTTQDFATTPQMRRVLDEITDCPPERSLRRLFLESKALELIVLFCDMLSPAPAAPPLTRDTNACLDKARAFIDARYLHPPTTREIARACYLSETALRRGFKARFGCTVYEYILERRLRMAHDLLECGRYKVKDVAWMVGYTNVSHFIDAFRRHYGLTPGECLHER